MSDATSKPLNLICPCGYTKEIPSEFDGKRIVCPKCRTILRIHRTKREASLLVRCPFCKQLQNYSVNAKSCMHCKRQLDVPDVSSQSNAVQRESQPPVFPLVQPSSDSLSQNPGSVRGRPRYNSLSKRRKQNPANLLLTLLFNVVLPFGMTIFLWYMLGERLGLPALPVIGNRAVVGSQDEPPVMEKMTPTVPKKPKKKSPELRNPITLNPNQQLPEIQRKPRPVFASPSIRILAVEPRTQEDSDDANDDADGKKFLIDVKMENLTDCRISRINFLVSFSNAKLRRQIKTYHTFQNELAARSKAAISLEFRENEWNEDASWTMAEISINRVVAGNDSDSSVIGPVSVAVGESIVGIDDGAQGL